MADPVAADPMASDSATESAASARIDPVQYTLHEKRSVDYTEIMVQAVAALCENTALRQRLAQQVKSLFVDELPGRGSSTTGATGLREDRWLPDS